MWKQFWPVYQRLEREFKELTHVIALADVHLDVYSITLADLILRLGSEAENVAKAILQQHVDRFDPAPDPGKIARMNFGEVGSVLTQDAFRAHTKTVTLKWIYADLSEQYRTLWPLASWGEPEPANPEWYRLGYNGLKHNRVENFAAARYRYCYEGLAAVLILNLALRGTVVEETMTELRDHERGFDQIAALSEVFDVFGVVGVTFPHGICLSQFANQRPPPEVEV